MAFETRNSWLVSAETPAVEVAEFDPKLDAEHDAKHGVGIAPA